MKLFAEYYFIIFVFPRFVKSLLFLIDQTWNAISASIFLLGENYFRIRQGILPRALNTAILSNVSYRQQTQARNPRIWSFETARLPNRNDRRILMVPFLKCFGCTFRVVSCTAVVSDSGINSSNIKIEHKNLSRLFNSGCNAAFYSSFVLQKS